LTSIYETCASLATTISAVTVLAWAWQQLAMPVIS